MLKTVLAMQGHKVDEAEDGITAVERALESSFDVAIIDIGLPGFDGYESLVVFEPDRTECCEADRTDRLRARRGPPTRASRRLRCASG